MKGQPLVLTPFAGRRVALLLDPRRSPDGEAIGRVLDAVDRAWDWYFAFFGQAPEISQVHFGKTTIAEVEQTCGAACGYLGATGIELTPAVVTRMLTAPGTGQHDQAVFYELGRNFFFYGAPLGGLRAFVTGFAHVHRFHAMEACALRGAAWDGRYDFSEYRNALLQGVLRTYETDNTLTWESTLAADRCPPNQYGWRTADFLAAAFYEKVFRDHGEAKYRQFWQLMLTAPRAQSARDSASRFIQIAFKATGQDYRGLFKDSSLPIEIDPSSVLLPLRLYWSEQRKDNFTTATAEGGLHAKATGYKDAGIEGYILPQQLPGTIPLRLYWHERQRDNLTTASAKGDAYAKANGYRFVRIEGYIHADPAPGRIALHLYAAQMDATILRRQLRSARKTRNAQVTNTSPSRVTSSFADWLTTSLQAVKREALFGQHVLSARDGEALMGGNLHRRRGDLPPGQDSSLPHPQP